MAGLMADRPDFHPAQDALRDLSGRVPGESRYGGPGQPPLSLTTPPNNDRSNFQDSPLLHSGSGSQVAYPYKEQEAVSPSVQDTLIQAGAVLHRTLLTLDAITVMLDKWEGTGAGPAMPYGTAMDGEKAPSKPGVQHVSGGLLDLSGTLNERVMSLENRLGHLIARVGGL